jgi:hypothetical protein
MYTRLVRSKRLVPAILGIVTLAAVTVLLCSDALPGPFPAGSHEILAAFSLATIALAYLIYQIAHRPAAMEFLKAILLVVAFLFWAANQFWPDLPLAKLFNDIAIALFVLDVFLVIVGWPKTSLDSSFGETCSGWCAACCSEQSMEDAEE